MPDARLLRAQAGVLRYFLVCARTAFVMMRLLLLFAMLSLTVAPARAAVITLNIAQDGDALLIEAHIEVDADLRQVWGVLTDYDRLADFMPGMSTSRLIAREAGTAIVDQRGSMRLLFFDVALDVRLRVDEEPYHRISSRAIGGNLKAFTAVYTLTASGSRSRLTYRGRLVPDFFVPPLVGAIALRARFEEQFGALADEIVRRQHETVCAGALHAPCAAGRLTRAPG